MNVTLAAAALTVYNTAQIFFVAYLVVAAMFFGVYTLYEMLMTPIWLWRWLKDNLEDIDEWLFGYFRVDRAASEPAVQEFPKKQKEN